MRGDLAGLTFGEFSAWLGAVIGHSERFHRALYRQVAVEGRWAPLEIPLWRDESPDAARTLTGLAAAVQAPAPDRHQHEDDPGIGRTVKVASRLTDGQTVESVLIPMKGGGHHTVCVSSQVGCKMGCQFCHTATMGLVRQLTAAEITGQLAAVRQATGTTARNVVFMGMGEPLDNPDAVARAVAILTSPEAHGLARRHVTISTVGRADILPRWRELGLTGVNLALSLTAADDALRSELMPVNRLHSLAELKKAVAAVPIPNDRRILVSCVVIPGLTDGPGHTADLIAWLAGLPVLVNLIPFNPIPSRPWRAPTDDEVMAVRDRLDAAGIPVRLRLTKGDAVMAACGQLGDPAARRRRPLESVPR